MKRSLRAPRWLAAEQSRYRHVARCHARRGSGRIEADMLPRHLRACTVPMHAAVPHVPRGRQPVRLPGRVRVD